MAGITAHLQQGVPLEDNLLQKELKKPEKDPDQDQEAEQQHQEHHILK